MHTWKGSLGLLLVLLVAAVAVGAQEEPTKNEAEAVATGFINKTLRSDGEPYRYVVYVPREYNADETWPMIVFLHGSGERGSDGLIQTEVGIGTAIRRHADRFPAIVLMPQCPKEKFWDAILGEMEQAMAQTQEEYRIDEDRIYLTGLSMGGYGAWLWGATKIDTFAAIMPICGGGSTMETRFMGAGEDGVFGAKEERIENLAKVPIWAFHGADDATVPPARSEQMVRLVKDAGGKVRFTLYEDTGHNSWDKAYGDEAAIKWLLKKRRK